MATRTDKPGRRSASGAVSQPMSPRVNRTRARKRVNVKVSFEGTPYVTRDTAALSPRDFRELAETVVTEHRAKKRN